MIFVTIGTQEPFDRLVIAMDEIARQLPEIKIVAQVVSSEYQPRYMETVSFLPPEKFDEYVTKADIVVSHAGMGTIISSLTVGRDLIIVPRNFRLGEHRNDHQLATAKKINELQYAKVVFELIDLHSTILAMLSKEKGRNVRQSEINEWASKSLTDSLRNFIERK